jgi:hypothetical protein
MWLLRKNKCINSRVLWKYKNKKGELVKLKKLRKVDNHGGEANKINRRNCDC